MKYIFLEASDKGVGTSAPAEFRIFEYLWQDYLSTGTAMIFRCDGNKNIAKCIDDELSQLFVQGDEVYLHFDVFNSLNFGYNLLTDIKEIIAKYTTVYHIFKYMSFEHMILETGVPTEVVIADNRQKQMADVLKCIDDLLQGVRTNNYVRFIGRKNIERAYPTLAKNLPEVATLEEIASSCCSQATSWLHSRFAVRKTTLGRCWLEMCLVGKRTCTDKSTPNVSLCETGNKREYDILHSLHAQSVFDLYTDQSTSESAEPGKDVNPPQKDDTSIDQYLDIFQSAGVNDQQIQDAMVQAAKSQVQLSPNNPSYVSEVRKVLQSFYKR